MPLIEWTDDFCMHNSEIDGQHRRWIAIMNNLHDLLMQGGAKGLPVDTEETLKAMQEYTHLHFAAEEEYLREIAYPDLAQHKTLHTKFYLQVLQLLRDTQEGKLVLNREIMATLSHWLCNHILIEDKKYSRFVAEQAG